MHSHNNITLFSARPDLRPFLETCARIVSDANYNTPISDTDLMMLYHTNRSHPDGTVNHAIAISALDVYRNANNQIEGFLFRIRKTFKMHDEEISYVTLDKIKVIFVEMDGCASLHLYENVIRNDFDQAVEGISVEYYLNQPSLHIVNDGRREEGVLGLQRR
jgi:hypothetical protein